MIFAIKISRSVSDVLLLQNIYINILLYSTCSGTIYDQHSIGYKQK